MRKASPPLLLPYILCWLPAFALEIGLLEYPQFAAYIRPVFFIFFRLGFTLLFLLGWMINTGRAAFYYPRPALGGLLVFYGIILLATTSYFTGQLDLHMPFPLSYYVTGAFSFIPLYVLGNFIPLPFPFELLSTVGVCLLLALSYFIGRGIGEGYKGY